MRTETAIRPQIASRTRETQPDPATPRRRQPSRAPTTASAASAATGWPSGAESADVLGIVKDPMSRPTDLANAASESVLGASNAGAGDPQRYRSVASRGRRGRARGRAPDAGAGAAQARRERQIVKDAGSTSGELANAVPERARSSRNAAEAVRGLPALRLDGAGSASPPRPRRPPSPPLHAKWALTPAFPPGLPDRSVRQLLRDAPIEREQKR